ncbi:YcnI family copper-binding membrane protein [Paenibacillus psychroresistens]|nr:YcnI family protein [Paenibacillus psychroresistens]
MKRILASFSTLILFTMLFAGIASAHVVVFPKETIQGSYEKFTVRVPSEEESPTIKVEVKVPENVEISRTLPFSGWKSELTKDADGKVISVIWTATADGLSSTEFGEFNMQGKVDNAATTIIWKAIQTYKDGSIVEWIGDEKSEHPASVTTVKAVPANATVAADGDVESADSTSSDLPLYLSIAAVVLALLSLIVSSVRKAR